MDRQTILHELSQAKEAHLGWYYKAKALIEGKTLSQEEVPIETTACNFGKWYFTDGQKLKSISFFKEIEALHEHIHETYHNIFILLFERSNWQKLIGAKISTKNLSQAKELLTQLEGHSHHLIKKIEQLEKTIQVLSEDGFQKLIIN